MRTLHQMFLIASAAFLVGCGPSTPSVAAPAPAPAIDASKEPLKAYAHELRVQYDLVLRSLKPGQMSQGDVDQFVESWKRISGFYKAAKEEYNGLTERAKENFLNDSLKYPWFSSGGFLGLAINKDSGEIMENFHSATEFLTTPWHKPVPDEPADLASIDYALIQIANDLAPILSASQKKVVAQPLAEAVMACFPEKKMTYKSLFLPDASGTSYSAAPYPRDWF